jgi:hypothetical protein
VDVHKESHNTMQFLGRNFFVLVGAVGAMMAFGAATSHAAATVQNPGLESDADSNGVPDCWIKGGYGTNSYSFARTSDAHTGSAAEKVTITSWSSGDRKLAIRQDSGACAPAVTPGQRYPLGAWYKGSTTNVQVVAYLRSTGGSWSYWAISPQLPGATGSWQHAAWTTPVIPSGYDHLSFGLKFRSTGSLTTDDYSMGTSETTPPDTSLTSHPTTGTTDTSASFAFTGTDNVGINHFECAIDGGGWTTCSSPKTYSGLSVGNHSFGVRAVDDAGNADPTPATFTWTIAAPTDQAPPPASGSGSTLFFEGFDKPTASGGSGCTGSVWGTASWASSPCTPPGWNGDASNGMKYYSVADSTRTSNVGSTEGDSNTQRWWETTSYPGNVRVQMDVRPMGWDSYAPSISSWAGFTFYLNRDANTGDGASFYDFSPYVYDGHMYIEKKCWGVVDPNNPLATDVRNSGGLVWTYYLLKASHPEPSPNPYGSSKQWHTFAADAITNADGSVTIIGYRDGAEVIRATDTFGLTGCRPITGKSTQLFGFRSDGAIYHSDNFEVTQLP